MQDIKVLKIKNLLNIIFMTLRLRKKIKRIEIESPVMIKKITLRMFLSIIFMIIKENYQEK